MLKIIKKNTLILAFIFIFTMCFGTVFSAENRFAVSAAIGETTDEYTQYINNWLNQEDAWADDAMDLATYTDYLNNYNSNKEVIVVVIDSGICTINPMFKDRIARVKESKTYTVGYTDSTTGKFVKQEEKTFQEGDLLGFAISYGNDSYSSTVNYTNYIGINPNVPADYKYYEFEDDHETGHGTAVSSVIASLTPKNVKILPIKKSQGDKITVNTYYFYYGILGMIKALKNDGYNIVAINMSFGFETDGEGDADPAVSGKQTHKQTFEKEIKDLRDNYNILTCISSGNEGINIDDRIMKGCESAIVCGMLEKIGDGEYLRVENKIGSDGEVGGSSYGESLDLMAPGYELRVANFSAKEEFLKTATFKESRTANGTSFSSPCVAAAVALLTIDKNYYDLDGNPIYTPDMIEKRLKTSALDMIASNDAKGYDIYYGYGMVNFKNHQIEINYETQDGEATYDGQAHNIIVSPYVDCNISYSLTKDGEYNIVDISQVEEFKNATNGKMPIYFKLEAVNDENNKYFKETKGVAYLTIKKRELSATVFDQQTTYGDILLDDLYKINDEENVLPGDEQDFVVSTNATNTSSVGTYQLWLTSISGNYNIQSKKGTLTIKHRDLVVKLGEKKASYGDKVKFDDINNSVIDGLIVNGDKLNIVMYTPATSTSAVGTYDIYATCLDKNYNVTFVKGDYIVTPSKVVLKMTDSISFLGNKFNGSKQEYEVLFGNVVEGDDLMLNVFSDININRLGEYQVWAVGANPNYEIYVQKGEVKVRFSDIQLLLLVLVACLVATAIIVSIVLLIRFKTRKRRLRKASK